MKIKPKGRIGRVMEIQEEIGKAVEEGLLGEEVAENMTIKEMEEYLGKAEVRENAINSLAEGSGLNEEEKMALGY